MELHGLSYAVFVYFTGNMFKKLQNKWGVGFTRLILILCVFAIGGSLSGYLAKRVMELFQIPNRAVWLTIYIIVVTLLWPIMVLFVSVFFGQFKFFKNYLKKMAIRMRLMKA